MQSVAIVGVGLIGASFGLALRKAGFAGPIAGVSSRAAIDAGLESEAISCEMTLVQAAREADLLYLAQPVDRILETLESLGPWARPGCLITDAGSTKVQIVERARQCLPPGAFLGGHPLAGKEQRGAAAAEADLFRDRPYVLTPSGPGTPATEQFRAWLQAMGAHILDTTAQEHDRTVALTSHLPQLLSTTLAATLAERESPILQQIFGPGLVDMTRLALSTPELWASIFATNKVEILAALDAFGYSLEKARAAVEMGDVSYIFNIAAKFAASVRNLRPKEKRN